LLKKVLYKILLGLNIAFAFSLLISYLAVHINPADFALPAFFGLAYPYLLLANIIFIVTWIFFLRFEALISVVAILIGLTHFSNYIKLIHHHSDTKGCLKVISYNVRLFNHFEKKGISSEKNILEFIKAQDPDIFCLQELFITGNPTQKETEIKTFLGNKYYSHIKVLGRGKNMYYGIATFSKFPIVNKSAIVHEGSASLTIYTDVLIKGDTFRIYNNHLQSFRLKKMERSFIEEITSSDNNKEPMSKFRNISLNLKKGFVKRSLQSQVLKDNIDRSLFPVIVLGDFNDTPVSYSYRKIRKGLYDSFVTSGYGAGFTYRGNYPPNRIDYILYDKSFICNSFDIMRIKYSDHYPIISYIKKKD
jgi:endonuclease/exonuclease/phosphatase family metal-dependent hydrolase